MGKVALLYIIACLNVTDPATCQRERMPLDMPLSIEECTSIPTGIEAHRYFEATQHGDLKWSGWTCIYDDETI
jgi:hypothetical protein